MPAKSACQLVDLRYDVEACNDGMDRILTSFSCTYLFSVLLALGLGSVAHAQEAQPPTEPVAEPARPLARYTPTVNLIEGSIPAVASIQTFKQSGNPGVFNIGAGSGSVIH